MRDKSRKKKRTSVWLLSLHSRLEFFHGQVVQLADTRRSERRARTGLGVQLSPWSISVESRELRDKSHKKARTSSLALDSYHSSLNFPTTQVDQSPTGSHKPGSSGATPEPAIEEGVGSQEAEISSSHIAGFLIPVPLTPSSSEGSRIRLAGPHC